MPVTTIEVNVDAARVLAFVTLVEKHAAAIRADLEEFMAGLAENGPVSQPEDTGAEGTEM
jgi:hypothetical protein